MIRAALFDVDGTLVNGHVWSGILDYPAVSRWQVRRLYMRAIPQLVLRRLYIRSETAFRDHWVRGLAGLLRGWSVEQLTELSEWIAADYLLPQYREDVIALLKQHKEAGHVVILVSTMFSDVLQQIARHLGADDWLGTALEIREGVLTGHIQGVSCVGPRKLDFVRTHLADRYPDISLGDCVAYADSYSDSTLLAAVGRPVAVYPDDELRTAALEQGWAIHPSETMGEQ